MATILLDVDGVLRNIVDKMIEVYKKYYDPDATVTHSDVTEWDMDRLFPKAPKGVRQTFFVDHAQEVFEESEPYGTDLGAITHELGKRHKIYIVTHQYPGNEGFTKRWLEKYDVYNNGIVIAKDKRIMKGDIALDDGLHNLEAYASIHVLPVAYNQPWNVGWYGMKVDNLSQFKNLVDLLF